MTIYFYTKTDQYGDFSNFAKYGISMNDKWWSTVEHYYQAMKFNDTDYQEKIRKNSLPMNSARLGRSRKVKLRKDWESVKDNVMYEAVMAKFTQHDDLRELLLSTDTAKIIEHTENDSYWGDGGDGSGKNRLGQILMRVREKLKKYDKRKK